jgi:hypothetical protein
MDSNQFRKSPKVNPYDSFNSIKVSESKFENELNIDYAPDNRYSKWPAVMSDGRFTTDYKSNCTKNIPVGSQYPTKQWLQHNATKLIDLNRNKLLPTTRTLDISVVPPPKNILVCNTHACSLKATGINGSIGTERSNGKSPELFGTFSEQSYEIKPHNAMLTHFEEGGRNTSRGGFI